MLLFILLSVVELVGVTGDNLRVRAFFDANNVKVGDPLQLTVDVLGDADFSELLPPALSRRVSAADWRLDDTRAKAETYRDARRLTYRVRPLRAGVLWFPALEFGYVGKDGTRYRVFSNAIPVHAKPGADVVVAEMEAVEKMPSPPPLVTDIGIGTPGCPLSNEDDLFAWRKACAQPTAEAFARFPFPAAKLNEARCAVLAGDWKRALAVYGRLEWRIGQTPELERGLLAALARKYANPQAELPVWREVARPLLRFSWKGRFGLVAGALAALAFLFWGLARAIRAVASLAVICLLPAAAGAQAVDPFAEMERMHRQMQQRMNQMMSAPFGGGGAFAFGGEEHEPVTVAVRVETDKKDLSVGEPFSFILSLEAPKTCSIGQIQLTPSERFGLQIRGKVENLPDGTSDNPTNVVKRLAVPVRYDVPFKGKIHFGVQGMVTGRTARHGGRFSFSFSNSFEARSAPVAVEIRPLPAAGQPPDFSGMIAERLRLTERMDLTRVETNDVVQITYRLDYAGYLPEGWQPKDVAFEWSRTRAQDGGSAEWRRYFVADGTPRTPELAIVYYDPAEKVYRTVRAGGTPVRYTPSR
jgi:hypothetical protein